MAAKIGHKTIFLEKFEEEIRTGKIKRILDMGSGLSLNFLPLLEKYPNLEYVGLEPSPRAVAQAKENLRRFPKARVFCTTGYEPLEEEGFDLVISLSVLEHVKNLKSFLETSVSMARPGARIVHRWDLGHALYPSSLKERLQVFLGNNFPFILPENKFVRYLGEGEVIRIIEELGASVEKTTYHQMVGLKKFIDLANQENESEVEIARSAVEWEFMAQPLVNKLDQARRYKLFPTIALWARKN